MWRLNVQSNCPSAIRRKKSLLFLFVLALLAVQAADAEEEDPNAPLVVMLWPEEGHVFRSGKKIIAAVVTKRFDPPREGYIELLVNGENAANFTPEAMDGEGLRRLHIVLPDFQDGFFSTEAVLRGLQGEALSRAGSTFQVDSNAETVASKAEMLLAQARCFELGWCESDAECSGHGTCAQGACLCHPNFAGETCEHDILRHAKYLPESDPQHSASRCHKSAGWEAAAKDLLQQLESFHRLERCADENNILWFEAPHHGLGGNMHILSIALTHAFASGKALGIAGSWLYGAHSGCAAGSGLGCYYVPYGECAHLYTEDQASVPTRLREEEPEWIWERRDEQSGQGTCQHYVGNAGDNPTWQYREQGLLWWRAQLLAFMMTPNRQTLQRVRQVKSLIGFTHPIIGLHIRHGDACMHGSLSNYRPPCKSPLDYLRQAEEMSEQYGVHTVFLATDDSSVLQHIKAANTQLSIIHVNLDRTEFQSNWFIEYRMKAALESKATVDLQLVADSTVLDLELLADCDYLIGAFSSHFSRLALEVMVARKGHVPPYASLDLAYGMDGQMPPYAASQVY